MPILARPILSQIKDAERTIARFWSKVDKRGPEDCWEWRGHIGSNGYGRFHAGTSDVPAHRFALAVAADIEPDPEKVVMHLCDNPPCVNPSHLREGTYSENARDAIAKGRMTPVARKPRTHCKLGHPVSGDNLLMRFDVRFGRAYPACRQCENAKYKKYHARLKAKEAGSQ